MWRPAEARAENKDTEPTHPAFPIRLFRSHRSNGFEGFSSRPGPRAHENFQSREGRIADACSRRSIDPNCGTDAGSTTTRLPALPVGAHLPLGRGARNPALSVQLLQAHVQHPHQHAARTIAQQAALADLRRNDGREEERPQERGRVRHQRDHLFALAQAFPGVLSRRTRQNPSRDHRRGFQRVGAHGGNRGGRLDGHGVGEGPSAGDLVLARVAPSRAGKKNAAATSRAATAKTPMNRSAHRQSRTGATLDEGGFRDKPVQPRSCAACLIIRQTMTAA